MGQINIVEMERGDPLLDQVEGLFVDFYAGMVEQGWVMPLVDGGEKIWRRSIEKTLGKLAVVAVAVEDGKAIGFIQGVLRVGPTYLGSYRLGIVTHIYVAPEGRARGVSKRMVDQMEAWFRKKEVYACELNAIWKNTASIDFWEHMGFERELLQMRKVL